jgi:uncharacterized protein
MAIELRQTLIPRDGRTLAARLCIPEAQPDRGRGVLFVHGLRSDQSGYRDRAEAASAQIDATCLTFDLGGHGESTGDLEDLSLRDHLGDVLAAYDLLAAHERADPRRIGVCAASYGAYLAALLISERPVQRLLLRAPALYSDEDLNTPIRRLRSTSDPRAAVASLARLERYGGEVLILESERDEVIPHAIVKAYQSAFPRATHRVIPDASHELADPAWRAAFLNSILFWFDQL